MNSPILKTALIISAVVAAPRAIAAQQIDRATAAISADEPARTHAKRTSAWGQITAGDIAKTSAHTAYDVIS